MRDMIKIIPRPGIEPGLPGWNLVSWPSRLTRIVCIYDILRVWPIEPATIGFAILMLYHWATHPIYNSNLDGIRTRNRWIRSPTRYPIAPQSEWCMNKNKNSDSWWRDSNRDPCLQGRYNHYATSAYINKPILFFFFFLFFFFEFRSPCALHTATVIVWTELR